MRAHDHFARRATGYALFNSPQRALSAELLGPLHLTGEALLELGAGDGTLWRTLGNADAPRLWVACDGAATLLEHHPIAPKVQRVVGDFDAASTWAQLERFGPFDRVLSSAALHWSSDLSALAQRIARSAPRCDVALYVAGTLGELDAALESKSPLPSADEALSAFERTFARCTHRSHSLTLTFDHPHEALNLVRRSGIGGGLRRLDYASARALLERFWARTLTFEALIVSASC